MLKAGLPRTAARTPRSWLTTSDSCGESIAGRDEPRRPNPGSVGSDMSITFTPASTSKMFVGQRSVVS